jgi:hypothetical protein
MPFRIRIEGRSYLVHTEVSENACARVVVVEEKQPAPAAIPVEAGEPA